ncbi:MAG: cation diffusion facilitator family transporter [Flavobacteriaceae bacterium]|jgi:cation diffusion facilitator family transporter|nr:cation diffusion facilitator family transporter [Flavobacteriaceae bacterium]
MSNPSRENYAFQKIVVVVGVILFAIKLTAWYLTHSIAILTDTLESIINILAGVFSLYSLYLSAKPRDHDHPYGHGKIEFISAGIEGALITFAGLIIIYEAARNFIFPQGEIFQLDYGIILIAFSGLINYVLGFYAVRKGKKNNSLALVAGGEHLKSDTYSTVGLVIGLILMYFTHFFWLDSVIALIFGLIIIFTGLGIIRKSMAGIMDEADESLINQLVETLETHRNEDWIDLHNVRFIKYGSNLHLDAHLTMPWFYTLRESKTKLDEFEKIVTQNFEGRIEMFVHIDGCQDFSCEICEKNNCPHRKFSFEKRIAWAMENIELDQNHSLKK